MSTLRFKNRKNKQTKKGGANKTTPKLRPMKKGRTPKERTELIKKRDKHIKQVFNDMIKEHTEICKKLNLCDYMFKYKDKNYIEKKKYKNLVNLVAKYNIKHSNDQTNKHKLIMLNKYGYFQYNNDPEYAKYFKKKS